MGFTSSASFQSLRWRGNLRTEWGSQHKPTTQGWGNGSITRVLLPARLMLNLLPCGGTPPKCANLQHVPHPARHTRMAETNLLGSTYRQCVFCWRVELCATCSNALVKPRSSREGQPTSGGPSQGMCSLVGKGNATERHY